MQFVCLGSVQAVSLWALNNILTGDLSVCRIVWCKFLHINRDKDKHSMYTTSCGSTKLMQLLLLVELRFNLWHYRNKTNSEATSVVSGFRSEWYKFKGTDWTIVGLRKDLTQKQASPMNYILLVGKFLHLCTNLISVAMTKLLGHGMIASFPFVAA